MGAVILVGLLFLKSLVALLQIQTPHAVTFYLVS